ncbi:unnamed protein product [Pseudo-nitzschia multistriata]|uniref:Cation efflux protein transmembrane domain-containing protein n=1 Tax=Pseudo-nitzschia multistriata TaxID=183589 RepID=A0A448ZNK2_9STRA|nr:unnamed protein product [Pseudo-nitzschia multistriata]
MVSKLFWKEPNGRSAYVLSWVSTIVTAVFAIAGIVLYIATGSVMCLVFGLENCVDLMSSVVVLWRFWASGSLTKEREKALKRRELRASMAISFILMILGFGVIATSSYDVAMGPETKHEMDFVLGMSAFSLLVCGSLALVKFRYASVLESESLYKDGVCSLIGTILAVALLSNTLIIRTHPQIWWLDPCVAMICGFAALFIGVHSVFVAWKHRRVPICHLSWWLMSRGAHEPKQGDGDGIEKSDPDGGGGDGDPSAPTSLSDGVV